MADFGYVAPVPEWVYSTVSPRAVKLYCLLSKEADAGRVDGPSRAELAEALDCAPSTVNLALDELKTIGAVEVESRYRGNLQASNVYKIKRPPSDLSESEAFPPSDPSTAFRPIGTLPSDLSEGGIQALSGVYTAASVRCGSGEPLRLCNLLAELIEGLGCRRPPVDDRWLQDARLLLADRSPEEVERVMRWALQDDFWRTNVLTMGSLRKHFDRLLLLSQRPHRNGNGNGNGRISTLTHPQFIDQDREGPSENLTALFRR